VQRLEFATCDRFLTSLGERDALGQAKNLQVDK
jgi:hypothetical protein